MASLYIHVCSFWRMQTANFMPAQGSVQPQQVAGISAGGATAMNPGGVSQVTQAAPVAQEPVQNRFIQPQQAPVNV